MNYQILATDYDGTIAHDGIVSDSTVSALRRAKQAGLRLILVTGREMPDLLRTFDDVAVFELIVAENGALLYHPATKESKPLAPPPSPQLLEALKAGNVPLSAGSTIVATVEPYEHQVLEAIHRLGLEWSIIFNKGSVMALPSGVNKATGLAAALEEMKIPPSHVIGVGDAENDQAFLAACGLSVAVANALPAVKQSVHIVTEGARGFGVEELIDRVLAGEFVAMPATTV